MPHVIFAATAYGYCVQVIDSGKVVYEYAAGNCRTESQAVLNPDSPGVVCRIQLRRWAKQTAKEIAKEREIPLNGVEYDFDLETQISDHDEPWGKTSTS